MLLEVMQQSDIDVLRNMLKYDMENNLKNPHLRLPLVEDMTELFNKVAETILEVEDDRIVEYVLGGIHNYLRIKNGRSKGKNIK